MPIRRTQISSFGGSMNWQDFFKLKVSKSNAAGSEIFFQANLRLPHDFPVNHLIMSRFDHLGLSPEEKRKLSLGLRKIILCHEVFHTKEFRDLCRDFRTKIERSRENELVFSTQGGGIYLFLQLLSESSFQSKKILCYTSELPLPILEPHKRPEIQFIYRPHGHGYLSDFSTLWSKSDLLELFELKDFKASA
jgi:hypothetical protein